MWAQMYLMWVQKFIESFNVGRDFRIESLNVVPLLPMNAGPCDYEFGSLQVGEKTLTILKREKISWIVDLNADGKKLGSINKRWQIRENADFH